VACYADAPLPSTDRQDEEAEYLAQEWLALQWLSDHEKDAVEHVIDSRIAGLLKQPTTRKVIVHQAGSVEVATA
jgi:hypothetical protein